MIGVYTISRKHLRRSKRMHSCETKDQPVDVPKEAHRVKCFHFVLDQEMTKL